MARKQLASLSENRAHDAKILVLQMERMVDLHPDYQWAKVMQAAADLIKELTR
jgi:hypothetical protein